MITFTISTGQTVTIYEGCFGSNSCSGTVVLTITSISSPTSEPTSRISSSNVRLFNGNDGHSGRVEIYNPNNGAWGSIDNDYWNDINAGVVCKQLGMGTLVSTSYNSYYGVSQAIQYQGFTCNGNEVTLNECRWANGEWSIMDTSNNADDVGVVCTHDPDGYQQSPIVISGSFQLESSSSSISSVFDTPCNSYCRTMKQAISSSMSSSSIVVTSDMIEIYQGTRKLSTNIDDSGNGDGDDGDISTDSDSTNDRSSIIDRISIVGSIRKLSTVVVIGFSTTVYTSNQNANAIISTLTSNYMSGSLLSSIKSFATSNGIYDLQNIGISSFSASSSSYTTSNKSTKNNTLSDETIMATVVPVVLGVALSLLIAYYYNTRRTLFIYGLYDAFDIAQLKKHLPG